MEILARQEFGLSLFQPLGPGQGLALGTMPIGAGIIGVAFVTALVTLFEMTAQCLGSAQFDGTQDTLLPNGQRFGMRVAKRVAMCPHNIGDFQRRPHGEAGVLRSWINHGVREKI